MPRPDVTIRVAFRPRRHPQLDITGAPTAADLARIAERLRTMAAVAANLEFQQFLQANDLDLTVQRTGHPSCYIASIESAEVKPGASSRVLRSTQAKGSTPEAAVAALAASISEQHIVVNANRPDRRDVPVPSFT